MRSRAGGGSDEELGDRDLQLLGRHASSVGERRGGGRQAGPFGRSGAGDHGGPSARGSGGAAEESVRTGLHRDWVSNRSSCGRAFLLRTPWPRFALEMNGLRYPTGAPSQDRGASARSGIRSGHAEKRDGSDLGPTSSPGAAVPCSTRRDPPRTTTSSSSSPSYERGQQSHEIDRHSAQTATASPGTRLRRVVGSSPSDQPGPVLGPAPTIPRLPLSPEHPRRIPSVQFRETVRPRSQGLRLATASPARRRRRALRAAERQYGSASYDRCWCAGGWPRVGAGTAA